MRLNDFGVITAVVIVILAITSAALHKHTKDCVGAQAIENITENEIDVLLNVPVGTSHSIIQTID